MRDKTFNKVDSDTSHKGDMGQRDLVSGKSVSMRIWVDEPAQQH
jgi:hypothetical protein